MTDKRHCGSKTWNGPLVAREWDTIRQERHAWRRQARWEDSGSLTVHLDGRPNVPDGKMWDSKDP